MKIRQSLFHVPPVLAAILVLTSLTPVALRAVPTLSWINTSLSSGTGTAEARAVTVDRDGNTIVVGRFVGTNTFCGSNLISTSLTIPSGFAAKLNPNGSVTWVQKLASTNWTEWTAVAVDSTNNIYIGGTMSGAFTNGPVGFVVPSANGQDAVVLKLNANGNALWGNFYGGVGTETILAMSTARNGTLLIGGNFSDAITFGTNNYTSRGSTDIFLARLNPDGSGAYSRRIGAGGSDTLSSLDVDGENNDLVAGAFLTSTDFGSGIVSGPGSSDIFVVKYAPAATAPTWYRMYTGSGIISAGPVCNLPDNSVVMVGSFSGSANFGDSTPLVANNGRSVMAVKLDKDGNFLWNKKWGDGSGANDLPRGAVATPEGKIAFTGQFKSNPSDWGSYGTTAGNGLLNTTFALIDTNGTVLWAKQIPTSTASTGYGAAVTPDFKLVFAGFTGSGDYGSGTIAVGSGGKEAFIAKYDGLSTVNYSVVSNYSDWRALRFTVDEQADPKFGGDGSDPDGDKTPNLLEYASNLDPKVMEPNPMTWSYVSNRLQLTYRQNALGTDYLLFAESSTNLTSGWTAMTNGLGSYTNAPLDPLTWQTTYKDSMTNNGAGARYLRLKAVLK